MGSTDIVRPGGAQVGTLVRGRSVGRMKAAKGRGRIERSAAKEVNSICILAINQSNPMLYLLNACGGRHALLLLV